MKSSIIRPIAITLVAALAWCLPASADYHYAAHDGSNEYPYTSWATAADSIQKAVDASSPHDTVYIGAGEWYETVATGVYDSIAIIGMGMDSTYLYSDSGTVLEIDYECSVEGIKFRSFSNWPCLSVRVYATAMIRNCRFTGSYKGVGAADGIIEYCIFDSCSEAIYCFTADTLVILNNYIYNSYGNGAIEAYVNDLAVIENNIILNWRGTGGGVGVAFAHSIIRNNIIKAANGIGSEPPLKQNNTLVGLQSQIDWFTGIYSYGNGDSVINNSMSGYDRGVVCLNVPTVVNYNNLWDNRIVDIGGTPGDTVGNIYCEPMYVSSADFHLQAYSPLIDAGDPSLFDVDGTRSDIGAYGGSKGESYYYQDLAPRVPDSLSGEFRADTIFLSWAFNTEADFGHYLLCRDTLPGFEPSSLNCIAAPETSYFDNGDVTNEHNYYYRVAAVDDQANASAYSDELKIITTAIWDGEGASLPQITSIQTSYPNPFNTSTAVVYWVANLGPIPAEITITIYDIAGRRVRSLVNERMDIGEHSVVWDGCDEAGQECAAGVYFARISQGGYEVSGKPRKLVLVK